MTNSMQEVDQSRVILVIGSNTTWCHPVFGGMIKRAARAGTAQLIVIDPRAIDLAKVAAIHVRQRSGSDLAVLMGIQHVIVREGWHDRDFIERHCEGWEAYRDSLAEFPPERVEALSGVAAADLEAIARLYATGGTAAIYYGMGITQSTHGVDNVRAVSNLALITGNLGIPGGGVNPLRGQSNVQGACDMGALPNVFPGYQPVTDPAVRARFAAAWGADPAALDPEPGLAVTDMVDACGEAVRALYIMGENPMMADPNLTHAEEQLRKLDFLVVQDIFLTETARLADVVLPATSFAERSGTYTNTERRVQLGPAGDRAAAGHPHRLGDHRPAGGAARAAGVPLGAGGPVRGAAPAHPVLRGHDLPAPGAGRAALAVPHRGPSRHPDPAPGRDHPRQGPAGAPRLPPAGGGARGRLPVPAHHRAPAGALPFRQPEPPGPDPAPAGAGGRGGRSIPTTPAAWASPRGRR